MWIIRQHIWRMGSAVFVSLLSCHRFTQCADLYLSWACRTCILLHVLYVRFHTEPLSPHTHYCLYGRWRIGTDATLTVAVWFALPRLAISRYINLRVWKICLKYSTDARFFLHSSTALVSKSWVLALLKSMAVCWKTFWTHVGGAPAQMCTACGL